MARIIISIMFLGLPHLLTAQSVIKGRLISVESRVFPDEFYVILVQDESGKLIELRIDDRITIKNERLLLYSVTEYTNYTLQKEEEPSVFFRNKFLFEEYEFFYSNKVDVKGSYRHCSTIKPYEAVVISDIIHTLPEENNDAKNTQAMKPVERVKINSFAHVNNSNHTFHKIKHPLLNINGVIALSKEIEVLGSHYAVDNRKLVDAIKKTISTYENIGHSQFEEWRQSDDTLKSSVRIFVSSIRITEETAKAATASKFISKILLNVGTTTPTKGHICRINLNILITPGPYTKPFNISITGTGGKPIQQLDAQGAYQQAITDIINKIYTQLTITFPPYTEQIQQVEVSKSETKFVQLTGVGQALNPKLKYGVVFFTDDHFTYKDGVIKFNTYLGKGRVETILQQNNLKVRITERGGDLKKQFDTKSKIRAMIYPLQIAEAWK